MAELKGGTTIAGYTAIHSGLKEVKLSGNIKQTINGKTLELGIIGSTATLFARNSLITITNSISSILMDTQGAIYVENSGVATTFSNNVFWNNGADNLEDLKSSVSSGKNSIAAAITGKGINASGTETFPALSTKIGQIQASINGETTKNIELDTDVNKGDPVYLTRMLHYGGLSPITNAMNVTPRGNTRVFIFSPDGTHLVTGFDDHLTPYMYIYKRNGDTYTKLADPATSVDYVDCGSFSPDGTHLVLGGGNSPYLTIYSRSGDTFTKIANPSVIPNGADAVVYSPDGTHLVVTGSDPAMVSIYRRSGNTYTKLANPPGLPTTNNMADSAAYSPDGSHLAVCCRVAGERLIIYKRNGDTYTKLASPTQPSALSNRMNYSPDGTYLAIALHSGTRLAIYKRNGDTYTKMADPSVLPADGCSDVAFSPNGNYLIATSTWNKTEPVVVYKRHGDIFRALPKLQTPTNLTQTFATIFSPDGRHLFVGFHEGYGGVSVFQGINTTFANKSYNYSSELKLTQTVGAGYAKESGLIGETKQISEVWR